MWRIFVSMNQLKNEVRRRSVAAYPTSDASPYAQRSLGRLPPGEGTRFLKAWRLLGRGGVLALAREGDMALAGAGVCEALLARSWAARHRDPQEMLRLALAAREVAAELKNVDLGTAGVAALQARVWGELANAYRVAGLLEEAELAFGEAFGRLDRNRDEHLTAHLMELKATWFGWCGNPEAALQRLSMVTEYYRHLREPHLAGRARITQSIYASRSGRKEEALRLSAEGLKQIDRTRDPLLAMTALHNRLLLLLEVGYRDETRRALAACHGLGAGDGLGVVALRLRWMEGRVLHGLGELEGAEAALRQSRDGLSALGLKLFSAMASLDLAATLLRQDRTQEAQAEALTAQRIFLGLERRHDFLSVLLVLDAAFQSGRATAELVERSLALLRRKEQERGPRPVV